MTAKGTVGTSRARQLSSVPSQGSVGGRAFTTTRARYATTRATSSAALGAISTPDGVHGALLVLRMEQTDPVRISLKVDYGIRAMAEIAADTSGEPVKAEDVARAQDIPLKYLLGILNELRRGYLLRSQRGAEGGYSLMRPADEVTLADIIRVVDGPLANVHDTSLSELEYGGPAKDLL